MQALTIGRLAHAGGVSAKTIRYYEEVGVLPRLRPYRGRVSAVRGGSRRACAVHLSRARLGLSSEELQRLARALAIEGSGPFRPCLRQVVSKHLLVLEHRIGELELLRAELRRVMERLDEPSARPERRRGGPAARGGSCRCLEIDDETVRQ